MCLEVALLLVPLSMICGGLTSTNASGSDHSQWELILPLRRVLLLYAIKKH
jgi:hypothetical protein